MPFSPELYARALEFAARAHGEQKTLKDLPYLAHVTAVAMEVTAALRAEPGRDEDLAVACALLHDVVEDTATTLAEIEAAFGPRVAAGVAALTKDESLGKEAAMRASLEKVARQPPEIAMVKLADGTTNMAPPPPQWTPAKVAAYRAEAQVILDTLGGVSPALAARLRERIGRYPSGAVKEAGLPGRRRPDLPGHAVSWPCRSPAASHRGRRCCRSRSSRWLPAG